MLTIEIPTVEYFNESTGEFHEVKGQKITLEHSLISVSKWEQIHKKPFLSKKGMNFNETVSYIKCMTLTQNINPEVYLAIDNNIVKKVTDYINDPMTATTFRKDNRPPNREIITSEILYYQMIAYGIPFECQKWHLNRLLTLIKVCEKKNSGNKKMKRNDVLSQNAALNSARRRALRSKG